MGIVQFHRLLPVVWLAASISAAEPAKGTPPEVKALGDPPGVHHLFALGTNVYSGGTPEGETGFAALAKLGIKTVISVDGAKPEVELAKKYGMRYVHLPHGYDGISPDLQLQLAKAAEWLPEPIYVHCHHGEHRGPAAAALICMAKYSWTPEEARGWLQTAGTSTNYAGLYGAVRDFKKPAASQLKVLPSDFPEIAKVSGLVDAMVGIDGSWEHLTAARAAGYRSPADHPDLKPANEAVILWEHYREAQRLPDAAHHGSDFIDRLKAAEAEVKDAERLLRLYATEPAPDLRARLDSSFDIIGKTCSSCHKAHRNVAGIKSGK